MHDFGSVPPPAAPKLGKMQGNGADAGTKGGSLQHVPLVRHLTTLLHASVVVISLSLAVACFDKSLFAWHPAFMSIGYLLFMTEGLISAIMFRHLDGPDRVRAIQSHALLQLRAVLCIAAGFAVIYRNKVLHNKLHFQSTHSKVGLATLVLSVVAPLGGTVSFRRLGIIQRFPDKLQPLIKQLHRQLGLITWLLALVTIQLALPHKAVKKGALTAFWQAGVAIMGVAMLLLHNRARLKHREQLHVVSSHKAV